MGMTIEEELVWLREENTMLREQLAQRDELIQQQHALLAQQNAVTQQHEEQMSSLSEQMKALRDRLAKASHNSHLSPASDRFVRQPGSLRKKSGKKPGGQEGHSGSTLLLVPIPDEVVRHEVARCQHCQADLKEESSS
jgi:transposase